MDTINYKEEKDEDLIVYLQILIEEDPNNRSCKEFNIIFGEFYERYKEYVYKICINFCRPNQDVETLTQEIFLKIYNSIEKFDTKKLQNSKKYPVKGWIGTIAKNILVNNSKSKNSKYEDVLLDDWSFINVKDNDMTLELSNSSKYKIALEKALEEFSEQERSLLYVYYNYLEFGSKSRLPKGTLPKLAKMFDVEEENFKKKRQRIFKKLKKLAENELAKLSP